VQVARLSDGKQLGYQKVGGTISSTPVVEGSILFVAKAEGDETLQCYDLRSGRKQWGRELGPIEASLLISGNRLFALTVRGALVCVDKSDGSELWRFTVPSDEPWVLTRSAPATDGSVIVFGTDEGKLFAVDHWSGTLRWTYRADASIWPGPVMNGGRVFVGSQSGTFLCLDSRTGELRWSDKTGAAIFGEAAALDTSVYIGSSDGILRCYEASSGILRWKFRARSVINSAPLLCGGVLYVGSLDHTLYAVRTDNGEELWRFTVPGRIKVSPVFWRGTLLVPSEERYVTAFVEEGRP
jgi:outer membrane protein assembly factor BamB